MPTEKLYWDDPFATSFVAGGALRGDFQGKPSIVLPKTLFYPEAGGQLADLGALSLGEREVQVSDVQIDDAGVIHHLASDVPTGEVWGGVPVRGAIDRERRRDHMAQHTAQHMLSRALADVAGAETLSARLGATLCTIDIDKGHLDDRDLARACDLVNAVVMDDVEVRQHFPSPEELARMPLRRAPKVSENIRVIEVAGFDFSPCGGTHCTRTGQIGVVTVAGVERYKGGTRVGFHAGKRAIVDARKKDEALAALAKEFTCGLLDVGNAVTKLRGNLKARSDALSAARGELVELVSQALFQAHPPAADGDGTRIVAMRDKDDAGMLRALAGRLSSRADVVAVCLAPDPESGELAIIVQRGASATLDCGKWLKELAARHGGRGGGRPERAEGRVGKGALAELGK